MVSFSGIQKQWPTCISVTKKASQQLIVVMTPLAIASIVCALLFSTTSIASEYYVVAEGGTPCPKNTTCHTLAYYTGNSYHFFTSDTTFYFLDGVHHFVENNLVAIKNVENLSMVGLGTIHPGFHESVMQSTVQITCLFGNTYLKGAFGFFNATNVSITDITINNCFFNQTFALGFFNSVSISVERISILNGSRLLMSNSAAFTIFNSSFAGSQWEVVIIRYTNQYKMTANSFGVISYCNFSFNFLQGLILHLAQRQEVSLTAPTIYFLRTFWIIWLC